MNVSLLHVVESGAKAPGQEFLEGWAESHQLGGAEMRIETGDVEATIERIGATYSLVILGATERGLLSRIIRGSLVFDTIHKLETPVLLAERPSSRSLRERVFGDN